MLQIHKCTSKINEAGLPWIIKITISEVTWELQLPLCHLWMDSDVRNRNKGKSSWFDKICSLTVNDSFSNLLSARMKKISIKIKFYIYIYMARVSWFPVWSQTINLRLCRLCVPTTCEGTGIVSHQRFYKDEHWFKVCVISMYPKASLFPNGLKF